MKLKWKIALLTGFSVFFSVLASVGTVWWQKRALQEDVIVELDNLGKAEITKIARDVWLMCEVQHENLLHQLETDLDVVQHMLAREGGARLGTELVPWNVDGTTVQLPQILIGDTWLGKNDNPELETPVLDDAVTISGGGGIRLPARGR